MRVFLLAVLTAAILAGATAVTLNHFQKPVSEAFTTTGARVSTN